MAKSRTTFNKNELVKARLKKKKEKEQKKEDRKANSGKGKGFEDMLAYVDAYGNIVSTPPEPGHRQEVNPEDIRISTQKKEDIDPADLIRTGKVTFFNTSKGYGFIKDLVSQEDIFVHIKDLDAPIKENDKVTFEVVNSPKGLNAIKVKLT
jgi:cold shock CspA family protein